MRGARLGSHHDANGTTFRVFTTTASRVGVRLFDAAGTKALRTEPLDAKGDERDGIFEATLADVRPGDCYKLVLDDDEVPDPYARFLPFGVHGPARVVEPKTEPALETPPASHRWVIYELHVGTFTDEGTYRAAIARLDDLVALGVTAVEVMPVHAFDGKRGWGYDSVALYAPYAPYGEPDDLRAFVRAAHDRGLAVILDVVYNHFGPAGNYLSRYAPSYFTSDVDTPWGQGPAFAESHLRALVVDNARYWLEEFGFDGLRLDATHAIHDPSKKHVLREIADVAHSLSPPRRVFFEDERNDPAVILEHRADAVWADDLHHQIHVLLTGERDGYYGKYEPTIEALAKTIVQGWGDRGKPAGDLPYEHFVTCIQNHDQVGNRAFGTRLSAHVSPEAFCAAVVLLLFLPTTPLLLMGQEWMATTPFLFFSDHEGDLGEAVRRGRREEFKTFAAFADPEVRSRIPDPQSESTFSATKLRWDERSSEPHARVLALHRAMLDLRKRDPVLSRRCSRGEIEVQSRNAMLDITRVKDGAVRRLLVNFGSSHLHSVITPAWRALVTSGDCSGGTLGPMSAVVLART